MTFDVVTIDEVLTEAKRRLGLKSTTDHDATLSLYIDEGVRNIKNLRMHAAKSAVLDIEDNRAKLPLGFYKLLAARYTAGSATDILGVDLNFLDVEFLNDCNVNVNDFTFGGCRSYTDTFKISSGYILFNSDVSATKLQIGYLGLNTDKSGNMIIYADYKRAIRSYACYMFASENTDMYSPSFIQIENNAWAAQKRWLRGDDQERHSRNNKYEFRKVIHTFFVDSWIT